MQLSGDGVRRAALILWENAHRQPTVLKMACRASDVAEKILNEIQVYKMIESHTELSDMTLRHIPESTGYSEQVCMWLPYTSFPPLQAYYAWIEVHSWS